MVSEANTDLANRTQANLPLLAGGLSLVGAALYIVATTMPKGGWMVLMGIPLAVLFIVLVRPRFQFFVYLIFFAIAWFPEFSQTEWDVHTAEDAPSLYNFRPIPGITASVFDYVFVAIVLVWVFKFVLPDTRRVLKVPFAKPMLALLGIWVFNLLHGLWRGNEVYYALREFRVGAYFVLIYFMVATTCSEAREIRQFIKLSVATAAIIGLYGILRYILGIGKEFGDVRIIYYDIADSMVLYIALLLIASVSIEGAASRSRRLFMAALMFPMLFSFVFSYRRGAWVAFGVGLLILVFFYPGRAQLRQRFLWRFCIPGGLLILLIAAVPTLRTVGLDFVMARIQSIFDVTEDSSNIFRILDAQNALNSFVQHPVIGVGAGGRYDIEFASQEPALMEFMEEVNRTSHDGYLYVLFKTGIIGFLIYVSVFAGFLRRWAQVRKMPMTPAERALFMAIGAIVVAFLMNNVTEPISDTLRPSLLLSFVMSWGVILMQELNSRAQSQQLV